VRIGPIGDERLKTGHWRELTRQEIEKLKKAAGMGSDPTPA
jgi:16S rRNA U516 pseudouridylate synthase RsuA-like enzyme